MMCIDTLDFFQESFWQTNVRTIRSDASKAYPVKMQVAQREQLAAGVEF